MTHQATTEKVVIIFTHIVRTSSVRTSFGTFDSDTKKYTTMLMQLQKQNKNELQHYGRGLVGHEIR